MGILYLLLISLIIIVPFTILRRYFDKFILIAFAIGSVVSANLYTPVSTPFYLGNIVFAIDSILYTLFIYCVVAAYFKYGLAYAKQIAISSIVAIIISAFYELFANVVSHGFDVNYLYTFILYLASALGSVLGIVLSILLIKRSKIKSIYLNIFLAIIIASVSNSLIYYGVHFIVYGLIDNFLNLLLGSIIGKFIASNICLLSYLANDKFIKFKI